MLQLCAHKHGKLTGKWQLASHCVFLPKPRVTDWANWRCEQMGRCSLAAWVRDPLDIKAPRLHVRHQVHLTSVSGPPPPPCRDWSDSHSEGPSPRLPQPKGTPVTLHAARPTICDTAPLPPDLQQPGASARAHTPLRPTAPHYAPIRPTTPHYTPACLATRSQQSKPPGTEGDPTEVQSEHFKAPGQTMETENVFLLTSI